MADAPIGRLAKLALALAVIAIVLVGAMMIVVVTRAKDRPRAKVVDKAAPHADAITTSRVSAHDVVRIDRSTVDTVTDPSGPIGIGINDAALRDSLQLDPDDVIVAISGKAVRRQFDVYDALLGASMMNASSLFVELQRAGKPRLVKWELDGDLREARTGVANRTRATPVTLAPDPYAGTVKKIDDNVYEAPRSTFEHVGTALIAGRSPAGGSPAGGSIAGRSPAGGSPAGGSIAGRSPAGGSPAGGSIAGRSPAGGSPAGGSIAGGSIAGRSPGIRVSPSYRGGSVEGVRLYAIRPGSIWQAIGLENGDTVTTVNGRGVSMTSLQDDFEALRKAPALDIEMLRHGVAIHLRVSITQ